VQEASIKKNRTTEEDSRPWLAMINSADGFGKKEEKTIILFLSITQKPRDYPVTILQNNPSSGPSCGWDSNPLKGGTLEREYQ